MHTNHTVQDGSQKSHLTQTVTVLMRSAMIWLKVKIPIPKLVVTIYRLSFLWPPETHSAFLLSCGQLYKILRLFRLRDLDLAFMNRCYTS